MICQKFENLTPVQKVTYIGELIHAVQSNDHLMELGQSIIDLAISMGIFDGVTILPQGNNQNATA